MAITVAQLSAVLTDIQGNILGTDFRPTFERAKQWIATDTIDCFDQSHAPDGTPWAPIHHRIGKPLIDTGLMYASVIEQIWNTTDITENTMIISVKDPFYIGFHQFGTARIKKREWFGLTDFTRQRIYADAILEVTRHIFGDIVQGIAG